MADALRAPAATIGTAASATSLGRSVGDSALRRLQLTELEILREFARRCDAEGLRWLVLGGTLLGAARHRGFIPWDDDVDVGMPRPDYDRFAALAARDAGPGLSWRSPATSPNHPFMYGKLALADGTDAWIDVFPIDGAPSGRLARRVHAAAFKLAVVSLGSNLQRAGVRRILAAPLRVVPRRLALTAIARLAARFPYDSSAFAVNASGAWGYQRECQPQSRFATTVGLEFEGLRVPVPEDWRAYLTTIYGAYQQLPPSGERRPRHASQRRRGAAQSPARLLAGGRLRSTLVAYLGRLVVRLGFTFGRIGGPRRYVVLATREPASMDANLRRIRDELARRGLPVPVVVLGYKTRGGLRGAAVSALEAMRAGYHLAAARLFVADNWFFPADVVRTRPGTYRVQAWHAAGAFKKFGYSLLTGPRGDGDVMTGLLPGRSNYDLCLVSSSAAAGPYAEAFRLPRGRVTSALGLPRTDLFFDPQQCVAAAAAVRRRYGLSPASRVALYAPTYRGDRVRDARAPAGIEATELGDALGPGWRLLVRSHPLVRARVAAQEAAADFVVDVSDWPDMNEVMLVADVLITDYSSAAFEFALLGRPVVFLAPDVDRYEAERGFYLDVRRDLPGPLITTTAELIDQLRAPSHDAEALTAFARHWFDVADGHAARRFVDRVVIPVMRGERPAIEAEPSDRERVLADPACGPDQPAPGTPAPSPTSSSGRPIRPS